MRNISLKMLCMMLIFALLLPVCAISADTLQEAVPEYENLEDLNGLRLGVWSGSNLDQVSEERFPDSEKLYYNTASDLAIALVKSRIDGFLCDEPIARMLISQYPSLTVMGEMVSKEQYGYVYAKTEEGKKKRDDFNDFLADYKASGEYNALVDYWFSEDCDERQHDLLSLSGENGVFSVAFYDVEPFCFTKNNQKAGLCVDMIYDYCKKRGYDLSYETVTDVGGGIIGATQGKYDCFVTITSPTEERLQTTYFTDSFYDGGIVMVVRNSAYEKSDLSTASLDSVDGMRMGIWNGSKFDTVCQERFPNCERKLYNSGADLAIALTQDKIDAFICDEPVARVLLKEYDNLTTMKDMLEEEGYACLFAKDENGQKLQSEFNAYLARSREDGRFQTLEEIWFGDDESQKVARDFASLPDTNGTIKGAVIMLEPFTYIKNDEIIGYCMDQFYDFCRENGYRGTVEMQNDASACILGTSSGKYDVFISIAGVTEERKQTMLFSDSVYDGGLVIVVKKPNSDDSAEQEMETRDRTGENEEDKLEYSTWEELDKKKIGVLTGSAQEKVIEETFPNCKKIHYSSLSEMLIALKSRKIDAYVIDKQWADQILATEDEVGYIDKSVYSSKICIMVNKEKTAYLEELNEYIRSLEKSGEMDSIRRKWNDQENKDSWENFDFSDLPEINGRIRLGYFNSSEPFNFNLRGKPAGMEIELLYNFFKEYGYAVDAEETNFSSLLVGCATGSYDIAAASTLWTEERAESVNMTEPYYTSTQIVMVRKANANGNGSGFFASIADSFEKNFIKESRWKLVLSGLGVTLVLAILSMIIGTILGFGLWALRRGNSRFVTRAVSMFIRFIQGIPVVVLLMVLYYVIFADSTISGIVVGVMGFSLNFSVYVAEVFRSGIGAVEKGQWEAASALGFSPSKTFVKVIFPQALVHILPVYKGDFISMMKMTSVVGYIAVQDLTKASDIIRSRTYDALFPLIATAIIYFLLSWALTSLLNLVEIRIDPKKRRKVLADVNIGLHEYNFDESAAGKKGETLITVEHLKKVYEKATPFSDLSTEIRRGDVISVIGPSGTGKSTLLRCINRLEKPTAGKIIGFGKEVPDSGKELYAYRQNVGMVFQSFNLFPHLTVIENLMLAPCTLKGMSRQEAYDQGMNLLNAVGLADRAMNYPDELSGGQKQRVAIVRTVAMAPEIILFDEPTSALDPTMVGEVLSVILKLAELGSTMMIVTHEMKFAHDVSNRVFYLDEGGIYEEGTPQQIFENPTRERTRAFIKRLRNFRFEINTPTFDYINLNVELEAFGHRELMSKSLMDRVLHVNEELITNGLLANNETVYPAGIALEYSQSGECIFTMEYSGEDKDVTGNMDQISLAILQRYCSEIKHSYADGKNTVTVKF